MKLNARACMSLAGGRYCPETTLRNVRQAKVRAGVRVYVNDVASRQG
jgi:hypothetical protein